MPDGEMTFAISIFVHPSNEFAMLLVGQSDDPVQILLAPPGRAGLCNDAPSPTLADRSPETTAAHRQAVHHARAIHAAIDQARANARGRSSLVIRSRPCLRWCACRRRFCAGVPEPCCLSVRTHPTAALACRESWRGSGCASGFMAATVRPNKFPRHCVPSSRNKFLVPPGPPLRCGRFAVQPARTSPFGSPTRPRWARP